MSEEATEVEDQEEGGEEAPKKGKLVPMILLLVGLAGGAAAGLMIVGPALASDGNEAASHEGDEGEAAAEDGHGEDGGEGAEDEAILYNLPNVIVNPAGTGGSRFLVVDLSLKMTSADAALEVEEREMEVRDVLVQLFGQLTIEQLANTSGREALKDEVAVALNGLLSRGQVMSLFMPRFVIQ